MSKYQNGQIYKIVDLGYSKCYIGSTCEKLYKRFSRHKESYNAYKTGKHRLTSSFILFEESGVENCKIEWIEDYPCNSKKELEAREGYYQQITDCLNKKLAGRTDAQWREENKDVLREKSRIYREEHREELLTKKQYRDEHKHEINEKRREQRKLEPEKNREQERQAYQRNKAVKQRLWTCKCGATMYFSSKAKHLHSSKKHQQYLQNQQNTQ